MYVRLYYVTLPPCDNVMYVMYVMYVVYVMYVMYVMNVCNVCNCVSCLSEGELKTRRRALLGTVGRVLHLT